MEANKRRKLDHPNGGPNLETNALAAAGASAFTLETEELLNEVKLDYDKTFHGVDDALRRIKDTIEGLESHDARPIGEVTASFEKTHKITIPYPEPKPSKESPYKLSFAKPAQVNVVGSYALKTMVKSQKEFSVDMIVVMPTTIFQEKDYLNLRYFYKRAYYLSVMASGIKKTFGASMDVTFEHLRGNTLLPILTLRPKAPAPNGTDQAPTKPGNSSTYIIKVIPCVSEGQFPSSKLSPTSNAIRQSSAGGEAADALPTPFYNATLKAESLFVPYLKLQHQATKSCAAFKDACALGRTWLQQRGFGGSIADGGFGHFEWATLIALLLKGGGRKGEPVLSSALSSTQLFKATVQYLAVSNFQKKAVSIAPKGNTSDGARYSAPGICDAAQDMNILYKMSSWSADLLAQHAKWSLTILNDSPVGQFDPLFIVKADQTLQIFDMLIRIELPNYMKDQAIDYKGRTWDFCDKVQHVLKKALGDRVHLIHIQMPQPASWSLSSKTTKQKTQSVFVGIILDPTPSVALRVIDLGPPAEDKKEAAKFRAFWGEKAELRKFADGRILESLDWKQPGMQDTPQDIIERIVLYILVAQLKLDTDGLEFHSGDFSDIASINASDTQIFAGARTAFEKLEREIRDLSDLPLHVKQVAPASSALRYASLKTPFSVSRGVATQPLDIFISFEASGKWPENLAAIQRAKIAFLLKIGSSLTEANEDITTHLGLEDAERDIENLAFLDIVYGNGVAFRLRVQSDLEEGLLDKRTKDKTAERHVRTEAAELLAVFKRSYTLLPLHTQTMATYCTRFPALSASIRLTKQWFNSHKLTCHFNEEVIELLVLQAFLKPYPWQTPSSPMTGFLRTLLLISRWDWREEPLIVDTSESLSVSDISEINTRLEAWRKIDPNMNRTVLFVANSNDTSGTTYTSEGPSRVVATRMTALARSACKLVKDKGVDLDPRSLFLQSLRDYDVVIHLAPKALKSITREDAVKTSHFKNLDERTGKIALPLVAPPAKMLLRQLNEAYGNVLLFFHGAEDDKAVAALWNPQLHERAFSANMPASFRPAVGKEVDQGSYAVNREAILAEIARLGGDLVEKIEEKEH